MHLVLDDLFPLITHQEYSILWRKREIKNNGGDSTHREGGERDRVLCFPYEQALVSDFLSR